LIAQGEAPLAAPSITVPSAIPCAASVKGGYIKRGGTPLAGVTGGSLTFSNNLKRARVIREDSKIETADSTSASTQGTMKVLFNG
jgi:hypothetical protein